MQGADLAVASRHVEGGGVSSWSLSRRFLSRGAQLIGWFCCQGTRTRLGSMVVTSWCAAPVFLVQRSSRIQNSIEVLGCGKVGSIAEVGYVFKSVIRVRAKLRVSNM